MNEGKLRERLRKAKLILGMVEETVPQFIDSKPSPIAFTAFDLCFYSSTVNALKIFEADQSVCSPEFIVSLGIFWLGRSEITMASVWP
jgi:hypothetical protein